MNEAEIVRCRVRADNVINGFTSPKIGHAKDVITLANALLAANEKISELSKPHISGEIKSGPDNFGDIFSALMKGKK